MTDRVPQPLISVIVPVYNVKPFLAKCIDSIIAQTYANMEVIIVDDGSTDGCAVICDNYAQRYAHISVIHKENGGLASARNAGIDVAKGDYLGFVDSDDFIEPFMYEKLMYSILKHSCDLAVCGINYVFDDGAVIPKANIEPEQVLDFPDAIREMNTFRLYDMGAWSKLYKKELFEDIRFPVGKLSEDFFIMYRIFERAQRIVYVPDACYNYFQRTNSITKSKKINSDFLDAAYEQMVFLDNKYPELSVVGHVSYASAALTVYDSYLKNKVDCPKELKAKYKTIVCDNLEYIQRATYLSKPKKIQFTLFKMNSWIYDMVFILYRMKNRV
ncbi:glycosyl transferase family 2 [Bifidobacterium sp. UTCIF-39]|uniref:glycosyltransferase n=1 Tax=Bifidobacterium sp. UTCIF-39 TaxID=1465359 RepID=UPI001129F318|nr:glycosyltransferase [Bifidobacterium sp. UTCIF-39]TPF97425.1 glycosyl transferase family 2 [Bifidobacterium sp. UTCIF-39]